MKLARMFLFLTFAFFLLTPATTLADEELPNIQALAKDYSAWIFLKSDFFKPLNGSPMSFEQGAIVYARYKVIGIGLDQWGSRQGNYWIIRPFITFGNRPFRAIAGYSTDTHGFGHVFAGGWFIKEFHKFDIFADLRYYLGVKKEASDFLDFFVSITHPLGQRFYAGIEGELTKWWGRDSSHNWSYIGPVFGVKITDKIKLFIRPTMCWNRNNGETTESFYFRTGLLFSF
jgi:hypothetical protein